MIDLKGNEYNVKSYEEKYRKIQLIEFEMLNEVDRICKKHGIRYYLCGGTLLGAVRHSGFIPWDDDLDIFFPRKDYIKFAEIAPKELPDTMFYQDWHNEFDYPYNFAKIRMNGTKFCQNEIQHLNMHHGIFIDIFPLDSVPVNEKERTKYLTKVTRLKTLMAVRYMSFKKNGSLRSIPECIAIFFARVFFSKKQIHNKLDNLIMKYDYQDTGLYGQETGMNALKEVYPVKWFSKQGSISFEGKDFPCTENKYIDEYMTFFYGDYMTPPPDEQKCQVHDTTYIDFGDYFND